MARRKLFKLYQHGSLKRWRPHQNHPWIYGEAVTQKWRHWLWLGELYCRALAQTADFRFTVERFDERTRLVPDICFRLGAVTLWVEVCLNGRLSNARRWREVSLGFGELERLVVLVPDGRSCRTAPKGALVTVLERADLVAIAQEVLSNEPGRETVRSVDRGAAEQASGNPTRPRSYITFTKRLDSETR